MVLVIFDVDGTLVHSDRRDSRCFATTFETLYGKSFPSIDWSKFPHVTDTIIFSTVIRQYFNREPQAQEVQHFQRQYMDKLRRQRRAEPEKFCEVPGARRAVHELMQREGYVVGIATGGWRQPARIKLGHVGIKEADLAISGADGNTTREDILNAAMETARQHHPAFEKVVYIGDAPWDVATTRNLSMDFVGVRHRHDFDLLSGVGAVHVIPNYLDFDGFLRIIHQAQPPLTARE